MSLEPVQPSLKLLAEWTRTHFSHWGGEENVIQKIWCVRMIDKQTVETWVWHEFTKYRNLRYILFYKNVHFMAPICCSYVSKKHVHWELLMWTLIFLCSVHSETLLRDFRCDELALFKCFNVQILFFYYLKQVNNIYFIIDNSFCWNITQDNNASSTWWWRNCCLPAAI